MIEQYSSELIPNIEKSAHCSTIIELPNGNLMVSFYAGTREAHLDSKIYISIYDKSSEHWLDPRVILDTPGKSNGNAVLFINKNKRIYLFNNTIHKEWKKFPRMWNWAVTDNRYMYSDDLGETWSKNIPLFRDKIGWNFRNKPIYLKNKVILFSMYDDLFLKSIILISKDDGGTWELSNPIECFPVYRNTLDHFSRLVDKIIPIWGCIQPTLIERNNGEIVAFLRPKNFKRILISKSTDNGYNWSKARETRLKNPQSGIDAINLINGNTVMVFNDSESSREILCIALSEDEGLTWKFKKIIEEEPKQEFSYPAIIQDKNGFIHITYTYKRECIKHVKMKEEWISS